jgi:LysM repeat protein
LPKKLKISKPQIKFKKLKQDKQAKSKLKRNSIDDNSTMQYVVQNGDTLFILSQRFNNKISTIKKLNINLGYELKAGTTIILKR